MAQYMLSVHSVEGAAREPMTEEEMRHSFKEVGQLDGYYAFHATRADLLRRLGRPGEAAAAYQRAASMAPTAAERDLLRLRGRASL